jgi:hypothetical protein
MTPPTPSRRNPLGLSASVAALVQVSDMAVCFTRSDLNVSVPIGAQGAVVRDILLADVNGDGNQDTAVSYEYYPIQDKSLPVRAALGEGHGGSNQLVLAGVSQPSPTGDGIVFG